MKKFVLSSNKQTKQRWMFYFQIGPKY